MSIGIGYCDDEDVWLGCDSRALSGGDLISYAHKRHCFQGITCVVAGSMYGCNALRVAIERTVEEANGDRIPVETLCEHLAAYTREQGFAGESDGSRPVYREFEALLSDGHTLWEISSDLSVENIRGWAFIGGGERFAQGATFRRAGPIRDVGLLALEAACHFSSTCGGERRWDRVSGEGETWLYSLAEGSEVP